VRLLIWLWLVACVGGCASSAFSEARRLDTAEAYRHFLREFPADPDAEPAQARLAELEFAQARALHTVIAYKRFLGEFPESQGASAARALLEGLRFNAARGEATANAFRRFLRDHPDGAHREEATSLLAEAEFREAQASKDPVALARLWVERAGDPRRSEVESSLDGSAFAAAKAEGAFRLFQYLKDFPEGAHREEARRSLLSVELDALLFSGLLDEARDLARRSPLSASLTDLPARFAAAEAEAWVRASKDPSVQAALAVHSLRDFEELTQVLQAPDALLRWEAVAELGQHVTVRAIDPLLRVLRFSRNAKVRQNAFESLGTVLRALPRPVADFEIARRLESLQAGGQTEDSSLALATLLDLSGRSDAAVSEYQKAFDPNLPDPVILRRWIHLRQERRQAFSAAVAARQLALWAKGVADDASTGEQGVALATARQLCAAAGLVQEAAQAVNQARQERTGFPEDLAQFEREVALAQKRVEARLSDAELALRTSDPSARLCADRGLEERLAQGLAKRQAALKALAMRAPALARPVLEVVGRKDPSVTIRTLAQRFLADWPAGR